MNREIKSHLISNYAKLQLNILHFFLHFFHAVKIVIIELHTEHK